MPEIFVSYSRKDQEFVKKFVEELERRERTVWVDWDSIPWTADWWNEIRRGIEQSDNIVFVVSFSSLTSAVCTLELDYAIQHHKRIIPIVLEETNYNTALEELTQLELDDSILRLLEGKDLIEVSHHNWSFVERHNWLFFNDEKQFYQSIANLLNAVDADLDHIRTHTRLMTRALEWKAHNREESFLLIGEEIGRGEQWLAASDDKDPKPTPLHSNYIIASRSKATQGQRRLLAGVSVALVITIVLGIISLFLWQQAETQRRRADEQAHIAQMQARISESGRIALQGLLELGDGKLDRALILAMEALLIDDNVGARSSLLTSLQSAPQLEKFLHAHSTWVRSVAYHPDGSQFATADADGTLILWDATTDKPQGEPIATGSAIWDIAYSPDGTNLAIANSTGTIQLWATQSGELLKEFALEESSEAFSVAIHPEGELLVSGHADSLLHVWNIESGEHLQTLEGHGDWVWTVTFNADGSQMASADRRALIKLWDSSDLSIISPTVDLVGHTNWVLSVAFNSDSSMLASGAADNSLRLWDTATGEALGNEITDHLGWVRSVQYSADGQYLVTVSGDQIIILRDASNGRRLRNVPPLTGHSNEVTDVAFGDSSHIISSDQDGNVLLWHIDVRQPFSLPVGQLDSSINALAFVSDDAQIFASSETGSATNWAISDTTDSAEMIGEGIQLGEQITAAAINPSGDIFAVARGDGSIALFDAEGTLQHELEGHEAFINSLAFNPDGTILASGAEDRRVKLWNPATGEQVGESIEISEERITAVTFETDGSRLAIADEAGQVFIWDTASNSLLNTFPLEHTDRVNALTFSPDGTLLASGSRDNSIIIWDIASESARGLPLVGHANWVLDIDFNPDGTLLASGSRDETLVLWDVETQEAIGQPFLGQHSWIWKVRFSDDGQSLLTGSRDGAIEQWIMSLDAWQDRACEVANRSISELERGRYLSDLSAEEACS